MADALTEIDLVELHQAIAQEIAAQFPALETVEAYREEHDRTPLTAAQLPACLFQLSEFENAEDDKDDGGDPGTGQQAVHARFEAWLVLSFRTADAKLEIRKLAAAFAAFIRKRRWKWLDPEDEDAEAVTLPTGPALLIGAYPDDFTPAPDNCEVWRVEWTHVLHLGETVWKGEDIMPTRVFLGITPNIGPDHIDDYLEVTEPPEV